MTMRDAFFFRVFEHARRNPDIVVLTSDFSAPSFDRFRTELPGQFINTGISEQNTVLVAAGLAQSGKTVIAVSIAPFLIMRCYEQTRLYAADMNLNIKLVGVGAGFSYNTAGPTHHAVEDIAVMRVLPHMRVYMPSSNRQVEAFADWCCQSPGPAYVRLDRMNLEELYDGEVSIDSGFNFLREGGETLLIANGYMTHTVLRAADELARRGIPVNVIDLYRIPADEAALCAVLRGAERIISVEEHVLPGGVGSYLLEVMNDHGISVPLKRVALDFSNGFYHGYGTRDEMHDACGIGVERIVGIAEGGRL